MTTAAAADVPVGKRLASSVRALKAARKMSTADIVNGTGIPKATYYERMASGKFALSEAVALAEFFDVPLQSLLDGQVSVWTMAPDLAVVQGSGKSVLSTSPMLHSLPGLG